MKVVLRSIVILMAGLVQSVYADTPPREIEVFLKPFMLNEHHGTVDLGELEPGHVENIILKVQSGSDTDLVYDFVESSCGCVAAVEPKGKLAIQTVNRIEVALKIPTKSVEVASASYISGLLGGVPRFTIVFKFTMKNTIVIPVAMAIEEVSESTVEHRFEIPFLHSADVTKEVVHCQWSKNVENAITSELDFGLSRFRCVLDVAKMSFPESASFTITTGNEATSVSIPVAFNLKTAFKVYPTALRLIEPKEAGQAYHGTLIVRDSSISSPDVVNALSVTASVVGGRKLKATATNISLGTWRVRVDVSEDTAQQIHELADDQLPAQCELVFVNSIARYVERVRLLFPQ